MNIQDVKETIITLENSENSLSNARNLAALYIIEEHMQSRLQTKSERSNDKIVKEFQDILPSYFIYKETKRKYQMGENVKDKVIVDLRSLCQEIYEFVSTLYSSTDSQEERNEISTLAKKISKF